MDELELRMKIHEVAGLQDFEDDDGAIPNYSIGDCRSMFVRGAFSPEAKEYWQQEMYTLDQITEMVETDFDDYLDHLLDNNLCADRTSKNYYSFKQWFNTNKKK